jgi:uncharacterized membrane protein YfcA
MITMFVLAAVLALVIGLTLGMLGGGGAILTLPMLVYAVNVEPKTAIATSLFVVGATSVVGMIVHARAGSVRWKVGAVFGAAAMVGAYLGGRLATYVPATVLLVLFGLVMVTTATMMLRRRNADPTAPARPLQIPQVLLMGAGVGVISGLVGAGGGFLIVPALVLFGGVPMREAIGTSLFVIALQSFAGFAGHATHVHLDWTLVAVITACSIVGSVVGAGLAKKVPAQHLRRGFAWLVIGMGLFLFAKQLPLVLAFVVSAVVLTAVFLVTRSVRPKADGTGIAAASSSR